jgi:hypothetical protein
MRCRMKDVSKFETGPKYQKCCKQGGRMYAESSLVFVDRRSRMQGYIGTKGEATSSSLVENQDRATLTQKT